MVIPITFVNAEYMILFVCESLKSQRIVEVGG